MTLLNEQIARLDNAMTVEMAGTVSEVRGLALHVSDLPVPIGAMVRIESRDSIKKRAHTKRGAGESPRLMGEVIGFNDQETIVMPLGTTTGVKRGDVVIAEQACAVAPVGDALLGRVLNGLGEPIDDGGPLFDVGYREVSPVAVDPMHRPLIDEPLPTGVRAVDSLLTLGRGQRIGVFASPGLGKSTLLGMMSQHTAADVNVIALVGERGREVREFIDNLLAGDARKRSVVVCATGDEPALLRVRAAMVATCIAEQFRDDGKDVLLIMDSVTRFCQAQRQIGLAAGEPPATKGYPPSVFASLPMLLERSGRTQAGSITGLYAVLVEGDDLTDPIADASRGVLDGHILLSQDLASRGHWPAIDVVNSISRVSDDVTDGEHQYARRRCLRLISAYRQVEDLVNIGAYAAGNNPESDLAIAVKPAIDQLLQQGRNEQSGAADHATTRAQLLALMQRVAAAEAELSKMQQSPNAPPQ